METERSAGCISWAALSWYEQGQIQIRVKLKRVRKDCTLSYAFKLSGLIMQIVPLFTYNFCKVNFQISYYKVFEYIIQNTMLISGKWHANLTYWFSTNFSTHLSASLHTSDSGLHETMILNPIKPVKLGKWVSSIVKCCLLVTCINCDILISHLFNNEKY